MHRFAAMRIALVSTCALATPPKAYGGTELVVAELSHGLTELGHDVVVYATGDSRPHGRLRALVPAPVWPPSAEAAARHARFALDEIARSDFDIVHVNDWAALPYVHRLTVPCVATLHHQRDEQPIEVYASTGAALVAISQRQADLAPELSFAAVIHHGLDPSLYAEGDGRGGYAAFLGRFAPEKGTHHAIDAAVRAGVALRLGGAAHAVAQRYFDREVAPRIERYRAKVSWLGELALGPKTELLRGARALLMPIDWEEPFGLVMIESMFVGTPVIAFPRGSVPEVVEEGITGFMVQNVDEMAARLRALDGFDRARCRARAIERFSYRRMARDHVALYERLIAERRLGWTHPTAHGERHAEHS